MGKDRRITEPQGPVNSDFRCGYVALAGRSNVGKSTLLNRILEAKVAIVTSKPQATRCRVLGIRTLPGAQMIWVDLPGIHRARSLLNQRMVDTARRSIAEADVTAVVIDASAGLLAGDVEVAELVAGGRFPWLLVVNKIDLVRRGDLLLLTAKVHERFPDVDVVPLSARTGENVRELERAVVGRLPIGPRLYPVDEMTDQSARAIVQEFVREKIYEQTGEEIPYRTAVVVDTFTEKPEQDLNVVQATILVERDSQKRILVGKSGAMIREIGTRARKDLEAFFGTRFFLELFVKVKADWTRNPRALDELGL
jgi:GTPase